MAVGRAAGVRSIFGWDLRYYALAAAERLGVEENGGMVRVGNPHYIVVVL
jgi:hypothetical protein